jgi:hypothetical protein
MLYNPTLPGMRGNGHLVVAVGEESIKLAGIRAYVAVVIQEHNAARLEIIEALD